MLIAFIGKQRHQELYAISKTKLGKKSYAKWNNYDLEIDQKLLDNIKRFSSIDNNNKSNNKPFRINKNRRGTEVFNSWENNNHHTNSE